MEGLQGKATYQPTNHSLRGDDRRFVAVWAHEAMGGRSIFKDLNFRRIEMPVSSLDP